jgi:hypothetical protein
MQRESSQKPSVPAGGEPSPTADSALECVGCGYRLVAGVTVCLECAMPRVESEGPQGLARLTPSAVTAAWWAGGWYVMVGVMTLLAAVGFMLERAFGAGGSPIPPGRSMSIADLVLRAIADLSSWQTFVGFAAMICLYLCRRPVFWRDWSAKLFAWAFWPLVVVKLLVFSNVDQYAGEYLRGIDGSARGGWLQFVVDHGRAIGGWLVGLVLLTRVVFLCGARVQGLPRVPTWIAGVALASAIGQSGVLVLWLTETSQIWSSIKITSWQTLGLVLSIAHVILGITLMRRAGVVVRQHDRRHAARVQRGEA